MKREIARLLGLAVFVCLGASATTLSLFESREVPPPMPFTVQMSSQYFSMDGELQGSMEYLLALRGDGSTAKLDFLGIKDPRSIQRRRVYDLSTGYKYVAFSAGESVSSYRLSPERIESIRHQTFRCGNVLSKKSVVAGYTVVLDASDVSTAFPEADSARAESWHAPALGCTQLKLDIVVENKDGTEHLVTRHEAQRVTIGDPDPALFAIPSSHVERYPSQALREVNRLFPEFAIEGAEQILTALDEAYQASFAN